MNNTKVYDVIILGAGPVGLYSSFISGYMKLETLCIEYESEIGGQPAKMYPNKYIFDFPGFKRITGQDLINNLETQRQFFQEYSKLITNIKIKKIVKNKDIFILEDENNKKFFSKFILLSYGLGSYEFKKINKELLSEDIDIQYSFQSDASIYDNKDIVILGGGDGAIDFALHIIENSKSKSVTLIHRRNELTTKLATSDFLEQKGIKIFLNNEIKKINNKFIKLEHIDTKKELNINFDQLIVQYGLEFKQHHIEGLESIKKHNNKFIINENYESSIPGIYVAGSCVHKEGRINMIVTGISEATIALNKIKNLLPETKKVFW